MGPENNRVPGRPRRCLRKKRRCGARLSNSASVPLNVLLIGGAPLGEPVARYGPFVMNTKAELHQAVEDYQNGRMGVIVAR